MEDYPEKIPDFILLREAYKEIGKLKSYIAELEDTTEIGNLKKKIQSLEDSNKQLRSNCSKLRKSRDLRIIK
jgi:regulator of replication initiation timing